MKNTFTSIDEYLNTQPQEVRLILEKIRQHIKEIVPGAEEAISYQMPTFKLHGKNLAHFAGWKDHIGFYPTPSGTENFQEQLAPYKSGKGSIQFPLNQPLPMKLITDIVKFRAAELEASTTTK